MDGSRSKREREDSVEEDEVRSLLLSARMLQWRFGLMYFLGGSC